MGSQLCSNKDDFIIQYKTKFIDRKKEESSKENEEEFVKLSGTHFPVEKEPVQAIKTYDESSYSASEVSEMGVFPSNSTNMDITKKS